MFFGGGLIPTYLLISQIGWLDNPLAILVPPAFNVWNMIIARTYYQGIPRELQEAADIDGASEVDFFFKSCFRFVLQLLPPSLCGSLSECGIVTLTL